MAFLNKSAKISNNSFVFNLKISVKKKSHFVCFLNSKQFTCGYMYPEAIEVMGLGSKGEMNLSCRSLETETEGTEL